MLELLTCSKEHAGLFWAALQDPETQPWLLNRSESLEEFSAKFLSDEGPFSYHVFVQDGAFAGGATLFLEGAGRWGSFEIFLNPDFRGRGLGKRALNLVEQALYNHGASALKIGVFEDNHVALNLYKSHAYQEVERVWYRLPEGRRRACILSDKPERFRRRKIGF